MVCDVPLPAVVERALRRCRSVCCETLELYAGDGGGAADAEFGATLLTVIAAIDVALGSEPERRERSVRAAAQVARGAAEHVRRYGLDERTLRCAAACEALGNRFADAPRTGGDPR